LRSDEPERSEWFVAEPKRLCSDFFLWEVVIISQYSYPLFPKKKPETGSDRTNPAIAPKSRVGALIDVQSLLADVRAGHPVESESRADEASCVPPCGTLRTEWRLQTATY